MNKEQVIDYVMTTPGNPNRVVLNGMLDSFANGSGGISVPVPTVEDAGKSIVVNDEGKYALANAGGGGTLVVRADHTEGTFPNINTIYDKTWTEVKDALASGTIVTLVSEGLGLAGQKIALDTGSDPYFVKVIGAGDQIPSVETLYACSADGYLQSKECESSGGGGDIAG